MPFGLFYTAIFVFASSVAYASGGAAPTDGLPQLNLSHYVGQIFWLFVHVVLAYVLIGQIAMKRLSKIVEARHRATQESYELAAHAKKQSEEAQTKYDHELAKANAEALAFIQKESLALEKKVVRMTDELEKKVLNQLKAADMAVTKIQNKARQDAEKPVLELATSMLESLIGSSYKKMAIDTHVKAAFAAKKG